MTWNLWWRFGDWERRQRAIVDTIRDTDADVVCLQEVWVDGTRSLATIIADELGYHGVESEPIGRAEVGFANAVLSRWPAERLADSALPGHDGTPGHRRVVAAAVESPWGTWPIASTHLDHRFDGSATRRLQTSRLLELASLWRGDESADLPVVIGGDLNAVPDSDEIRLLTGRSPGVAGIVFSDVWEQRGVGPGITWRRENPHSADSAWPDRRIDYVLVSWPRPKPTGNPIRAWTVANEPVDVADEAVWASDHSAVVAELVTPSDQRRTTTLP
jgi:endonuclease/exonuclease/phosphatase family metal-dependent hydrolase